VREPPPVVGAGSTRSYQLRLSAGESLALAGDLASRLLALLRSGRPRSATRRDDDDRRKDSCDETSTPAHLSLRRAVRPVLGACEMRSCCRS